MKPFDARGNLSRGTRMNKIKVQHKRKLLSLIKLAILYEIALLLVTLDKVPESEVALHSYKFKCRRKTTDYVHLTKYYEAETTEFLLNKKGDFFVDVGAHIGRYSVLLSKNFKKVVAFEPVKSTFNQLNTNVSMNCLNNVKLVNAAAYEKAGNKIIHCELNLGSSSFYTKSRKTERIKTIALDNIVRKADLIKIDVEGAELHALKGAKQLLTNNNPILVIESFNVNPIKNYLKKFGYSITDRLDHTNFVFEKNCPW